MFKTFEDFKKEEEKKKGGGKKEDKKTVDFYAGGKMR